VVAKGTPKDGASEPVDYRILGPLEARRNDEEIALGGAKQRTLLAVLLLHANASVPRDRLIDELWGDKPPETARATLQVYVSQLRKALGREAIETRGGGYGIWLRDGALDADRFERLVHDARDRPAEIQAEGLREALALWRGEHPLADVDDSVGSSERARLVEQRLAALEQRVQADLELGRHADLVPELEALVRDHPLRERLRGQLMLALYRSGRQADALETYREGRRLLDEELGLKPREELRELEKSILVQDPAIAAPRRRGGPRAPETRRPRRRWAPPAAAVLVAGAVAAAVLALTTGASAVVVEPDSIAVIDPGSNRVIDDVHVGGQPVSVAVGYGSVWVADKDHGRVLRLDPVRRKVTAAIQVGSDVSDLAVGFGSVWAAGGDDGTVDRIDPVTNGVFRERGYTPPVRWVATDPAGRGLGVWATSGSSLVLIDPSSDEPAKWIRIPIPTGLAASNDDAWITTQDDRLLRFAGGVPYGPSGSPKASFFLESPVLAPATNATSVWLIAYGTEGQILTVPSGISTRVRSFARGGLFPLDLAVRRNALWSVDVRGTVRRYDVRLGKLKAAIRTAPTVRSAIAVGEGKVWVAIQRPS
jgi:YVTN family beta-propeller protein